MCTVGVYVVGTLLFSVRRGGGGGKIDIPKLSSLVSLALILFYLLGGHQKSYSYKCDRAG